ncbi:hypothetical protein L1987_56717 [Smallanthus sonchifolius]|uniref:Uncharacterized protein n=1 Tax=Smallanthus sonchifolius TaxID=185202 RepID=A0ACB9EDL3_9ASTR|nr:hypothetical protein L1987_56717 [Smallanthus sonchifolius]
MLGILHEWGKSLLQTWHKDAIKTVLDPNSGEGVLDITSDPEEEIMHKKRKKKNRKGGGKKSKRKIVEEAGQEDQDMAGNNESKNRKKYKIWSSKNRKPEKNLPMTKHIFRSGDIPRPQHLLGFSEFRVGHEGKTKRGKKEENSKRSQRRPVGEFYSAEAEIEEKLSATIGNITSKDVGSKLVNSVKGMPSCKLSKFSAHVNDVGEIPKSSSRKVGPRGNGQGQRFSSDNNRTNPHRKFVNPGHQASRKSPGNVQVKDRNVHQPKGNNDQSGGSQKKGNEVASNMVDELITGEYKQNLHHGTNGENNNGTPMEEVESKTDAMASLMKNNNLEIHHVDSDLDMSPLQHGSPKGPIMTLSEDIVVSA